MIAKQEEKLSWDRERIAEWVEVVEMTENASIG
jgi:hypothetical protein